MTSPTLRAARRTALAAGLAVAAFLAACAAIDRALGGDPGPDEWRACSAQPGFAWRSGSCVPDTVAAPARPAPTCDLEFESTSPDGDGGTVAEYACVRRVGGDT